MSYYPIQLDKARNLRYGMRAIDSIEKKLKKPVGQIDMENLTMEDAATLIWAGLAHEDKDLTVDKVMDLVDDYSDITTVMTAMSEAFAGAFGEGAALVDADEVEAAKGELIDKMGEIRRSILEKNE